ncbi:MAG: hypothetical protein GY821_04045 [Gammaproteobacteria bacterium]|nr:hypothetical protein [Gammaproteobacteria bacterium]
MNSKKRTLAETNFYSLNSEPPKKRQKPAEICYDRSAAPQPPADLKKAGRETIDLVVSGFFNPTIQAPTDIRKLIVNFLFFAKHSNHNGNNNVNERSHTNQPLTNFLL